MLRGDSEESPRWCVTEKGKQAEEMWVGKCSLSAYIQHPNIGNTPDYYCACSACAYVYVNGVRAWVHMYVCVFVCVGASARVSSDNMYASKYLCIVFHFIVYRHDVTQASEHIPFFLLKCTLQIENGEYIFYYICMHVRKVVW